MLCLIGLQRMTDSLQIGVATVTMGRGTDGTDRWKQEGHQRAHHHNPRNHSRHDNGHDGKGRLAATTGYPYNDLIVSQALIGVEEGDGD